MKAEITNLEKRSDLQQSWELETYTGGKSETEKQLQIDIPGIATLKREMAPESIVP
jgi:hypothetical protein